MWRDFISLVTLLELVSFLKRLGKRKSDNLKLRCIVELLGTNQTRDFKPRKDIVLRFLWKAGCKLSDQK